MTPAERFATVRVARLATVTPDGAPHLVPIVFALAGDVIHTAVDGKPKRHRRLRRLANIEHEPRVSVLADHYADDWSELWWVRADGLATITDEPEPALLARYPQYATQPPPGPFLRVEVTRWTAWQAQT
ncbi:PPOX class F420-dependent oxidoreductase [Actinoplanes ianthinogenes]|uniref:PPOX class F420-dependent oxidoreductase n=1 Tax=Actinoplanes ianthinogenes TaxID=122358 RepID=A0ABM7LL23_9ACTN|nr:TIGR03668 family PPOX class F420-dependent oxidoreductase [Actinoplanes ianthinogenes]BCJ39966.1 PPOX class F420-dependent oxidoreductase [Actinoplanes ianthinogenes]GGR09342.1 PPOX class F420-dependent oxidoreductase [Actinoplanes ianthinogenes]